MAPRQRENSKTSDINHTSKVGKITIVIGISGRTPIAFNST